MNWVIVVFAFLISSFALYYGLKLSFLYLKVKRWDRIAAGVLKKGIIPRKLASADAIVSNTLGIEYSYIVDGTSYTNNKVFLVELIKGEKGFQMKTLERRLEKIGDQITVFVNPAEPSESVVFCDGIVMYVGIILISILGFMIGIAQLIQ
jgi:hypothetical protein